ncbi:hypothetical protein ElP_74050 (plasmid) [Tautonia plasticadhaerens]|uniref:Uncharacterized protein n=1 Tax=Tautonia plasticadhaerens TaxID=2527974 RepID=A0A518HF47_9BACT|nr:hypothetical protein ElP_74050 [Tautonia plasticadhaerens]
MIDPFGPIALNRQKVQSIRDAITQNEGIQPIIRAISQKHRNARK